jgi:hypothetical protein
MDKNKRSEEDKDLPGYPTNPPSEDIYTRYDKEDDTNIENPFNEKEPTEKAVDEYTDDLLLGSELDIPGSELDDDMEIIGNEDEENNYYSLGSDDNDALEDDSLR